MKLAILVGSTPVSDSKIDLPTSPSDVNTLEGFIFPTEVCQLVSNQAKPEKP
jgi:hypothetical protein